MSTLSAAMQEPGVEDLPVSVRRFFAAALHFEREGKPEKAESYLTKAIEAEAKLAS